MRLHSPEPASTYDSRNLPDLFFSIAATVVACGFLSPALLAQGPTTDPPPDPRINAPGASVEIAKPVPVPTPSAAGERRFWDKENVALCTASAALSAADFAVTRANLQSGGQELNSVVHLLGRSTLGLAVNFIGENAEGISLSYFFHKTRHHRLERIVSR